MDTRPDHLSNRLRLVKESEETDARRGRSQTDSRQAVLPGLEDVVLRTVQSKSAREAFGQTTLAVRGALQLATKIAAADLVELRQTHTEYKDASQRLEAAKLAQLAGVEGAAELVARRTIEHEHALERLHQRRKTATPTQAAYGSILKAANIAGHQELGDKVGSIEVRGSTAFDAHLEEAEGA